MTATRTPLRHHYTLALFTLVYAMNIADRFVVSTILEPLRLDLRLSDATVALITGTALALFYVTLGLPIAVLADRSHRRNIVAVSLALWSGLTAACGLAQTVLQFVIARLGVGVGEAGGTPPSTALLADLYRPAQRPAVLTVFALGAPLGAWFGSSLAGAVAAAYGWRGAFLALGVPGIVLAALVVLTVREPARRADRPAAAPGMRQVLADLGRNRAAVHLIGGGSVATLWGWGLLWWMPTYLGRTFGLSVAEAGALLGPMHLVGGGLATVATFFAVAPLARRGAGHVSALMAAVVLLATIPSVAMLQTGSLTTVRALLWTVIPAIYFFIGPTMGLLQNVVAPAMRAQTIAVLMFVANVMNLVVAPQLVGLLSDALCAHGASLGEGLRTALVVLAPTGLWAGLHYALAARAMRAATPVD